MPSEVASTAPSPLVASGLRDVARGERNLASLQTLLGPERLARWLPLWQSLLLRSADADMALNNLERFLTADGALSAFEALLVDHPQAIETLINLFGTSQFLSDTLVMQPSAISMLGLPLRRTPTLNELVTELATEIEGCYEDSAVLKAIRHYRARHLLRIGINDIIRDRPLEEVTADIADVAQAAVQVALSTAQRSITRRFGEPRTASGELGQLIVLAFGKLGGRELNYSSDIDLMVVYNEDGQTTGKLAATHEEYCSRVTTEMLRLLTTAPAAYRVDFRLRPEGQRGPLVRSLASTLSYYDTLGRTWERQALIKVRPIAGSVELGQRFLQAIEPFIYRRYLSLAEIGEIKAIKRKIEQRAILQGDDTRDVKTGYGGIRDVEFVIQFLQLLNGGELPSLRSNNTLQAITALLRADCLSPTEGEILEKGYRFLRRTEHRLQLLSDLQTHHLPERPEELRRLALRLGYRDLIFLAQEQFEEEFAQVTLFNRKVLNHLLHDAFADPTHTDTPESDLILLPEDQIDKANNILQRYGFRDPQTALHNLQLLAQEPVPFLPTRRCRHFLASIAPKLLMALSETPDPDMALTNLEKVTASLGAKGVLWELFSFNEPSLKLYVDLCSSSQYLSQILMSHPGMIDELLDSLVLDQPKSLVDLRNELSELCRGADPQLIDRILHSFQNKELLRIGVQDILGKQPLRETLAALSKLAEAILGHIVEREYEQLCQRWGVPSISTVLPLTKGDLEGVEQAKNPTQPPLGKGRSETTPTHVICRYVLVGLGKLGGREMSYQSDLDLILIYEDDGQTQGSESTNNIHFFSELAQRVIKSLGQHSPLGRLYQVDMRLRPTGKSGSLVVPLEGFRKYYAEGSAQLWERQALTRGRVVSGDDLFGQQVIEVLHEAAYGPVWLPSMADEILTMRKRMEASSKGDNDLKRGVGGIVDVEFLVQLLLLKYGRIHPQIVHPNVWDALAAIQGVKLLDGIICQSVVDHYQFLRTTESRQRMVYQQSLDTLPTTKEDLVKLVRRLGYQVKEPQQAVEQFLKELGNRTARMREIFLKVVEDER
ncbi:MAG TPA: bifunctional [glutamate--ammonia ligase]-adenylyl-L-tyrosine phosphorylase/[glutamate--ammonia-ligase] adenylyltransferase [Gemmatales bacterium]|nr:bifunctional [glutamate--ammonia ligase]-adenylyl-L-tyrosine phosphorylase/[glutamate--ammonia-ligase] adenylyltransferase [Gemmatales bacterium]